MARECNGPTGKRRQRAERTAIDQGDGGQEYQKPKIKMQELNDGVLMPTVIVDDEPDARDLTSVKGPYKVLELEEVRNAD